MNVVMPNRLLFDGADWTYETILRINDACEAIAHGEMGLKTYPNQIEIITTEQMLDAYSSVGMPLFYKPLEFRQAASPSMKRAIRKGLRGLAYEIVINSDPCVSYIMEENSATMQTLVIAHAAFGHNHFFKQQLPVQAVDPGRRASSAIPRFRQGPSSSIVKSATATWPWNGPSMPRTCAAKPRRPSLPPQAQARSSCPNNGASVIAGCEFQEQVYQRPLAHRAGGRRRARAPKLSPRSGASSLHGTAAGKHPLFPGKDRPAASNLGSARSSASFA